MNMVKRTEHGEERHEETERPTSEAEQDKTAASEIYLDIESMFLTFLLVKKVGRIFLLMKDCTIRVFAQQK